MFVELVNERLNSRKDERLRDELMHHVELVLRQLLHVLYFHLVLPVVNVVVDEGLDSDGPLNYVLSGLFEFIVQDNLVVVTDVNSVLSDVLEGAPLDLVHRELDVVCVVFLSERQKLLQLLVCPLGVVLLSPMPVIYVVTRRSRGMHFTLLEWAIDLA